MIAVIILEAFGRVMSKSKEPFGKSGYHEAKISQNGGRGVLTPGRVTLSVQKPSESVFL